MTKLTCEEFFDAYLQSYEFDSFIDEMYWDDSYSTDSMFDYMKRDAARENVELTDVDSWDYDTFFHNVWKNTEKGLS